MLCLTEQSEIECSAHSLFELNVNLAIIQYNFTISSKLQTP